MLYSNRNHNSTPLIAPVICLKIIVTPAIKIWADLSHNRWQAKGWDKKMCISPKPATKAESQKR